MLTLVGLPRPAGLANRWLRLETLERAVFGCDELVTISAAAQTAAQRWLGRGGRVIHPGTDPCSVAVRSPPTAPPIALARSSSAHRPSTTCASAATCCSPASLASASSDPARGSCSHARATRRCSHAGCPRHRTCRRRRRGRAGAPLQRRVGDRAHVAGRGVRPRARESLACGTPVVASTDGAGPEIIDRPGIGALFDAPEPDAVATALLGAIDLPDPAAACRARAEQLSLQRCAEEYETLYRTLLDG